MDGRSRAMTFEERREAVVDVLAQAVLKLAVARRERRRAHANEGRGPASGELATPAEQRLHVHETAGDGRRLPGPRDAEEQA